MIFESPSLRSNKLAGISADVIRSSVCDDNKHLRPIIPSSKLAKLIKGRVLDVIKIYALQFQNFTTIKALLQWNDSSNDNLLWVFAHKTLLNERSELRCAFCLSIRMYITQSRSNILTDFMECTMKVTFTTI